MDVKIENYFLWGLILLVSTLVASLSAYYTYSSIGREFAFFLMILSLLVLFFAMMKDLSKIFTHVWFVWFAMVFLLVIYVWQRLEFPRFDFMVGDASDYFAAGICSVTYNQDIGYILPLSATITGVGYEVFGIKNVLLAYVILYSSSIPIFYYLFRKLNINRLVSFSMSIFLIFVPLSLWFSKTSFTEPIWQVLLFSFVINMYMVLQKYTISWKNLISMYAILFLAPMLRVEGVFYYGFIFFLSLYHFWKYSNLKVVLLLNIGLFIVAISTQITLKLRPDYLLNRQFNRILPHVTEENVIFALYILAGVLIIFMLFVFLFRKLYTKFPFVSTIIILSLIVKLGIAYIYAIKKHMTFMEMLYINEYGLAVGNFGLPITLLMIMGLVLLYIKAFKGDILSLLLVVVYTIFYLPFSMQAVTFSAPHAFFFYWNRYYFSVLMMIHLLSLGLVFQWIYTYLQHFISDNKKLIVSFISIFLVVILSSMSIKLYQIVSQESHLKDSYQFYDWVKKYVGQHSIYMVTEDGVVYKQNTRPDGLENIEYLIGRTFSIYKMPERGHEVVSAEKLYPILDYTLPQKSVDYILCIGHQECHLDNPKLLLVDTYALPLMWREHFGLDKNASFIHHGDITQSVVQHVNLKASLYKVGNKFVVGKELSFKSNTIISGQLLGKGWRFINNSMNAFSAEGKGIVILPNIKKDMHIKIRYAILNATVENTKQLKFKIGDEVVYSENIDTYATRESNFVMSQEILAKQGHHLEMTIVSPNGGQIMLRSLTINHK